MTARPSRWRAWAPDLEPLRESPAFRNLYLARTVSLFSVSILAVAVAWQVYELSASSLHVAGVTVGLAVGSLIGLVWGGTLADRGDRRRTMIWSRAAYVGVVALLGVNSALPEPGLVLIYLATVFSGLTSGLSAPSLMAALPRLVPLHHLASAGALNALAMEVGRLTGPLIAGALLAHSSITVCYGVVLAGAAMVPILLARLPRHLLVPDGSDACPGAQRRPALHQQWLEGLRHVGQSPVIASLLALDLVAMLFLSIQTLMPQLGQEVLRGGPEMVGYLYAAPAVGALIVAMSSGWTRTMSRPGRLIVLCTLLWGIAVFLAGLAAAGIGRGPGWTSWLVLVCLAVAGMADTATDIVRGALLQIHTPDALRGRISGLWLLQGYFGPALGGLQIAGMATVWSPARALMAGGGVCAGLIALGLAGPRRPLRRLLWGLGIQSPES